MTYIVTAVFQADVAELERVESERPDILEGIFAGAQGRMLAHTRYVRDGVTMDIDEYASEESYREFYAIAEKSILAYGEAVGAVAVDTGWTQHGEGFRV